MLGRVLRLPGWEALPTEPTRVNELLARLEAGDKTLALRRPETVAAHEVYRRVVRRLTHLPVQDLRVDFQGVLRPDDELDADASAVAIAMARGLEEGTLPPRCGVRIGALRPGAAARSLRTLDLVVSTLADRTEGVLPEGFLISVTGLGSAMSVSVLVQVLGHLEERCGLRKGSLKVELGVDRVDTVLDPDGRVRVRELMDAARGRCTVMRVETEALAGAVGSGVASLARDLVHMAAAGTGVQVSAGTSPPMPDPTRYDTGSPAQRAELFARIHSAWRTHYEAVGGHLRAGTPWGWDLDPTQVPARLAAVVVHARATLDQSLAQLADLIRQSLADELQGLDRLAEGQAQLDVILRWLDCGAVDASEVEDAGLDSSDIEGRSFRLLLARRKS